VILGRKKPLTVFYSYSHRDEKLRNVLATHLSILKRQGIINEWHDRKIVGGEDWESAIEENLESAEIVLLLISPDFIASDYCWGKEMTVSLARHESGKARVIPILLRPVDLKGAPFTKIEPLPKNNKFITLWNNRDQAWLEITKGIREASTQVLSGHIIQDEVKRELARNRKKATIRKADMTESLRPGGKPHRTIYVALSGLESSRAVARREGSDESGDRVVDEVYKWFGICYDFFWNIFERNSIDGKGMKLFATVYHGAEYNNLYWVGNQLVIGDNEGDEAHIFNRFASILDIFASGFVEKMVFIESRLKYSGQSASIIVSFRDVFASLIKQYWLWQKAYQADWLIGAGIFSVKINGIALRSLKQPGTGYDDIAIGKDPQPDHMKGFVKTTSDDGGAHINCGIPSHVFYLTAIELGGYSWEKAGRIWYHALLDKRLKPNANFKEFAEIVLSNAKRLYGYNSAEAEAVKDSWKTVGIRVK